LLPVPALEIVDDWHVLGLAGTGSKSLRGEDVFVPEWRSLTVDLGRRLGDVVADRLALDPTGASDDSRGASRLRADGC
jgi:alkylation response protein AidB-like acyl-CoA dehydrogenase